ncbi:hypothetical protein EDD21DRAFT_377083 [Dissophora ornata]|nr:hypothetical protein EDD21DRAFT_377083 [Dissophora ornata]
MSFFAVFVLFKFILALLLIANIVLSVLYFHVRQDASVADPTQDPTWKGPAAIATSGALFAFFIVINLFMIITKLGRVRYVVLSYLLLIIAGGFLAGIVSSNTDLELITVEDNDDTDDSTTYCVHPSGSALCQMARAVSALSMSAAMAIVWDLMLFVILLS